MDTNYSIRLRNAVTALKDTERRGGVMDEAWIHYVAARFGVDTLDLTNQWELIQRSK